MAHPAPQIEPKTKPDKTTLLEVLQALGEAAGVVTGLAFISGWLYWSTYYANLGLNPLELDFPIAILSVTPLQVLWFDLQSERDVVLWPMVIAFVVGCVLMGFFVYFRMSKRRRASLMLCLSAIFACAGAFKLGHHDAALDLSCDSRLPDVAFVTGGDKPLTARDTPATCITDGDFSCKLVIHVNSIYHYFVTPEEDACAMGGGTNVTGTARSMGEIPESQIRLVRVQRRTTW